jgi:hypothetical protein
MDMKNWLNERYTFFEEIFEFNESYCLEFCLKEDLKEFIDLCFNLNVPFTFYPSYKLAIQKNDLKNLLAKLKLKEQNKDVNDHLTSTVQELL